MIGCRIFTMAYIAAVQPWVICSYLLPTPPSHLEPHLGPNLEKSVTMHAFKFIFIYILFKHKLIIYLALHNTIHHFI